MKFNFHTFNLTFKKKFSSKKINYLFAGMLLLSTVGAFSGWLHQIQQETKALATQAAAEAKIDPAQNRMQKYLQNDIAATTSLVGRDIAKFKTKLLKSANEAVLYNEDLPYTGIIFVNTSVSLTKDGTTTIANAYDYVNLKYVHFDLTTEVLTDVLYAPPPGLFTSNPTVWPSLTDNNNSLRTFFPSQTIRNVIKSTFNLNDTFTKIEWFNAFNKTGLALDLSNNGLFSIAELFNPNLRWGLGIYDLVASANFNAKDFRIKYRGLSSLLVSNNNLAHFPNPQFYNFPALKIINADSNNIKAIGNFNTFSNFSSTTEYQADLATNSTNTQAINYYEYLTSLWADTSEVKDRPEVQGIKKWLTVTLPMLDYTTNQATLKTGKRIINDYNSFLEAVSADDVFLNADNGEKWINQKTITTITSNNTANNANSTIYNNNNLQTNDINGRNELFDRNGPETNSMGIMINGTSVKNKGTNVAGVKLQITKDINEIDFSNNEIERLPLSYNMFTVMNFSGNKLKYLTPFALQPYPWAYNISSVYNIRNDTYDVIGNSQNWNNLYKQSGGRPGGWDSTNNNYGDIRNSGIGDVTKIPPFINFYNNNLLDVWPQQGLSDSWYTWPRLTTKFVVGTNQTPNSNVYGAPISPFNRQIGGTSDFYPWFHQVWLGNFNNPNNGPATTLIGFWTNVTGYTLNQESDALSAARNLESVFFRQLVDNKLLISNQSYQKTFSFDTSKNQPFVLPGFETSSKRKVTIKGSDQFNDRVLNNTSDAYKSYNSHVPYILTRTWPQNMSNAFSLGRTDPNVGGNPRKIKATLTDNSGADITPNNFNDINWEQLYAIANDLTVSESDPYLSLAFKTTTSNYTPTITNTNGGDFLTKVLGQLPYYNDRGLSSWANATGNKALGIDQNIFQNKEFVQLKIEAPSLSFQFDYTINILSNLNYTAFAKNPMNNDNHIENIQASNFSKKDNFASEIQELDLINEQASWLNASEYVKNYIIGSSNVLSIKSRNLEKGEITVGFNVVDAINNKINLDDITIKGFATQKVVLVKDQAIIDNFNTADNAFTIFAPDSIVSAQSWIQNHIGIKWIGLSRLNSTETTSTFKTGSNLNALENEGIYLLSELENPNQYISGIVFDKNEGFLTFTIQINGTITNGNVNFVQNYTINSFARFDFDIDTSTASHKQGALDFLDPVNLRQFVRLKKTHQIVDNDGNVSEQPIGNKVVWDANKDSQQLIAENLIPAGTTLNITNIVPNAIGGNVTFLVRLNEATNESTLINNQQGIITGLSTFSSSFDWKQNNNRFSGIAFIPYEVYANQLPSTFLTALTSATNQNDFENLIYPLIDLSKSAPLFDTTSQKVTGTQKLEQNQLDALQLGFGTDLHFTTESIQANVIAYDAARLVKIDNLYLKGGYKDGKFYAATEANAPVTALSSLLVSFFAHITEFKAINNTYNLTSNNESLITTNAANEKPSYAGESAIFARAFNEWNSLLPSEWFARLRVLKNNQPQETQVNYEAFDTVAGFLNHVLNTSTSNVYYGTRIDINNLNGIEISDFKGTVNIKANTLLIYNEYKNSNAAISTEVVSTYDKEISFVLNNFFKKLPTDEVTTLPFASSEHVTSVLQDYSGIALQNQLQTLVDKAQKLYDVTNISDLSIQDQNDAISAIRILSSFFINPNYNNANSQKHFITPFTSADTTGDGVGKQIRFKDLNFTNTNYNTGTMQISITIENFISGYGADNKFVLESKTHNYQINNLPHQYLLPSWQKQTALDLVVTSSNPVLQPIHNQIVHGSISLSDFNTIKAADYYRQLLTKTNPLNTNYLMLESENDPLFKLTMWNLIEASGLSISDQSSAATTVLEQLIAELAQYKISFNVKKSDVYFDETSGHIYIMNPFLNFAGVDDSTKTNQILQILFNSSDTENGLLDANNNWYFPNFSSVILEGFQSEPLIITPKNFQHKDLILDLTDRKVSINNILPSDLFNWLMQNYHDSIKLANFLNSFYTIQGTSLINHPIYLTFSQKLMDLLKQPNVSLAALNMFIRFNDGLGTFDLLNDAVAVVNGYLNSNTSILTRPEPVKTFFASSATSSPLHINLTQMNYVNTTITIPSTDINTNGVIASGFENVDLQSSVTALEKDNFALAYNFLQLNEIALNNNQQQIVEIIKVEPNDVDASIIVHYVIHFGYENGQTRTIHGQYTLTGFVSKTNSFLRIYLPIIAVAFVALAFGLYLTLNRMISRNNSLPFTTVNRFRKPLKQKKKKNKV